MKFFCNTREHGRIRLQRFSQERALSHLVAKYETSWWLKSNLVLSSIIGQKMSLIALTIWISQGFEKNPKMAQKWSENGFLALSLEPNHLGPKFLHFLGPHTWLDHGQTISQLFWKFTLGALVDFKKRMILSKDNIVRFVTNVRPLVLYKLNMLRVVSPKSKVQQRIVTKKIT